MHIWSYRKGREKEFQNLNKPVILTYAAILNKC